MFDFFAYLCALFETSYDQRRFARLSENAGYSIDMMWEQKRGPVEFTNEYWPQNHEVA